MELGETHLRWFGDIRCRPAMAPKSKSFSMQIDGISRKKDRPKSKWMEVVNDRSEEILNGFLTDW